MMSGFGLYFLEEGIICQISCFIKLDKLVSSKSDRNGKNSELLIYTFYDKILIMCLFFLPVSISIEASYLRI